MSDFDDIFIITILKLLKFKTPTKTVLEAVLFMYLLTITNNAGISFFMTKHGVVLLILDMESAKPDVNGRKTIIWFCSFVFESDKKKTKKMFQKRIDPIYIGSDKSFYIFKASALWAMLSISQFVRPCVRMSVCLSVCKSVNFWGTV